MANPEPVPKFSVETWNRWRHVNYDAIPYLPGARLINREGSEFFGALLERVNLENAHLEGANFLEARLEGANFMRAHLQGANFVGTQLQGAHFVGAHLEGAHFDSAHLAEADFSGAHLEGAHFWNADVEGACFNNANVQGAHFKDANLQRASFRRAQLQGADFTNAHLQSADLSDGHLAGVAFVNGHLEGATLMGASLMKANFSGARLKGAQLTGANLKEASLASADLSNADLRYATGLRFDDTKILHARLDPQPGAFWQRWWLPWFILHPLTDPWSTLRRAYTGPNFAITLISLLALLLPLVLQTTYWRGVNQVQVIMQSVSDALKCDEQLAGASADTEQDCILDASEWLAAPKWLVSLATWVSERKPCFAAECRRPLPVIVLLMGWHRGEHLFLLTSFVLLYGAVRWYVTTSVSAYRDEEERSGYTPAWAPAERHSTVGRGGAGYAHLVRLHILLRCLVVAVVASALVNWSGVLFLPIVLPSQTGL